MDELRAVLAVFDELAKREYKPYPDNEWTEASREFGRLCSPARIRALLDMASRCVSEETLMKVSALLTHPANEPLSYGRDSLQAFADVVRGLRQAAEARAREGR